MPSALLRPCAHPGCPALTDGARCPQHRRQSEQRRGSAAQRGYGTAWRDFRLRFIRRLIALGIAPVCGSALPDGPAMSWSQCRRDGRLTHGSLHLDHEPPLRADQRADPRAVCDTQRVGFLCDQCHRAKTIAQNPLRDSWM